MIRLKKISKFKRLFLEATAERDQEFRAEAQTMCDEIKSILKDQEYIKNNAQRNEQFQGYVLGPSYSDYWSKNHPKLYLIIGSAATGTLDGQSTELKGGYSLHGNKHIVVVSMLKAPYDLEYADTRFPCDIFVHEFIHYLDRTRMQDPTKKYGHDTTEDYLNNPMEYNAHYQEAIYKLHKDVNSMIKHVAQQEEGSRTKGYVLKKIHDILDSYDKFEAAFIKKFGNDFDKVNEKYQTKTRKRLYSDWEALKKQASEHLGEKF